MKKQCAFQKNYRNICLMLLMIFTGTATAQVGKTLVLNGCTDFLEFPENDLMDFQQTLSIECWIQPNCKEGNNVLLSKQWCNGDFGYYLSVNEGKLSWTFSTDGFCNSLSTFQTVNSVIPTDQFTHVAVVHTSKDIKLFINGLNTASEYVQGKFGLIAGSEQALLVGVYQDDDKEMSNYFSGQIDEIRYWNIELTETLILQRKDKPLTGNEPGLLVYLNMEQSGQGSTLYLLNHSPYGGIIDASPIGFTPTSPYTTDPQDYGNLSIDLGEDIITCEKTVALSVPSGNYKSILWSNNANSNSIEVSNSGIYSVRVETEMCKFYTDSVSVEISNYFIVANTFSICENDTLEINNHQFTEGGVYYDTIAATTPGCDTVFQYLIIEIPPSSTKIFIEICPNAIVNYAGQSLVSGSITTFLFKSIYNCDSTVTVEVTPSLILRDTINLSACENGSVEYDGAVLFPNTATDFAYTSIEGCDSIVMVSVATFPALTDFLGNDTLLCKAGYQLTSPDENTTWSTGETSNQIEINTPGTYTATFTDDQGCINTDTIQVEFLNSNIYVPNVFHPDGSGINDCFKPFFPPDHNFSNYRFSVFDRWGGKVFQTSNLEDCWDGTYNGKLLNSGVYIWLIERFNTICSEPEVLTGDVLLVK